MYIRKLNKGFTLVELIGVSAIAGTMVYLSSSLISNSLREMKFNDYAAKIDYFAKYAKINSIKSSTYTALCLNNKILTIKDIGSMIATTPCSAGKIIKTLDLSKESGMNMITSNNPPLIYDGRGMRSGSTNNTLCITNGRKFVKYTYLVVNSTKQSKIESTLGSMSCN